MLLVAFLEGVIGHITTSIIRLRRVLETIRHLMIAARLNSYLADVAIREEAAISDSCQEYMHEIQGQYLPIANAMFGQDVELKFTNDVS